jgi:ubiquinone/menaquinone biosynthesis C-methylase UbiE
MMKPKDIGQAYNKITHLWESDSFDRSNGIIELERAMAFVKNGDKALDVGCGCTGRFIDLLLSKGFHPEGVDISEKMIKLAKKKHPEITFYQQDICRWNVPKKYDFITAWDSLWHIPINQQEKVLTKLVASLNSHGVLIFSFGGTEAQDEHKDSFMGPEIYYSSLGINTLLKLFVSLNCICRHLEYSQYPELHAYLIVQKT